MGARSTVVLVIAAALGASGALAQVAAQVSDLKTGSDTQENRTAQTQAGSAPAAGGVVVFIDPATGKVRQPDAAEIGKLVAPAQAAPLRSGPLIMKTGPGTAVGVMLDSSFDASMVATKTPDGKVRMGCVTGNEKAAPKIETKETLDVQ